MSARRPALSFRRQLARTVVLCILIAVAIVTATTAWMVAVRTEALMRFQGTTMAVQFAQNSEAVLLIVTGDPASMKGEAGALARYPGVISLDIVDAAGAPIIQHGTSQWRLTYDDAGDGTDRPAVRITEDAFAWHFVATIAPAPSSDPFSPSPEPQSEVVGYVHIAFDKTPARNLVLSVIGTGAGVALFVSGVFVWWANKRIRTLTEPLSTLAERMAQFAHGAPTAPASLRGPEEVANIARVFNELTQRIAAQTESLEETVEARTQALRVALDRALSAERHKSDVMAMFTHEMRGPLHGITSYVAHVRHELRFLTGDTRAANEHLDTIEASAAALLHHINQILTLSRLEAGPWPIDVSTVDMAVFVDAARETTMPRAVANQNSLAVRYEGPDQLRFDADKVGQIVRNLLDNACKFTTKGRITLSACYAEGHLAVTVTDTGIGIPKASQAQVFEPFYQVDMSATRVHQGTGLGLAITQRFCALLGGALALESVPEEGTTVSVRIPATAVEGKRTAITATAGAGGENRND